MNTEYIILNNNKIIVSDELNNKRILDNNNNSKEIIKCENMIDALNIEINNIKNNLEISNNKLKRYKRKGIFNFIIFSITPNLIISILFFLIATNTLKFNIGLPIFFASLASKIYGCISSVFEYYKHSKEKSNNLKLKNHISYLSKELENEKQKLNNLHKNYKYVDSIKIDYKEELIKIKNYLLSKDEEDIKNGIYEQDDYIAKVKKLVKKKDQN